MSTDLAQLAPLAVLIPFLGAALNFVIVHRNRLQRTVTVGAMALTLVLDAVMPVSYTHLDVYKRQVCSPRPWRRGSSPTRSCSPTRTSPTCTSNCGTG